MRIITALNHYFLSEEEQEIHPSDKVWLYAFYSFVILLPVILWLYIR